MILDKVTITGADDSVDPEELIPLARDFPFVEWGILFSKRSVGVPRYPSESWTARLCRVTNQVPMRLSAHLCGAWVRDFVLDAKLTFRDKYRGQIYMAFDRLQLNFHAHHHAASERFKLELDTIPKEGALGNNGKGKQVIFQMDGVNDQLWDSVWKSGSNHVPLFDRSGGAGVLPKSWPAPYAGVYCGYAGGLGPDNLTDQLALIDMAAPGPHRVWVDMETKVRSDDDSRLDLDRVRACLEAAAPFVTKEAGGRR